MFEVDVFPGDEQEAGADGPAGLQRGERRQEGGQVGSPPPHRGAHQCLPPVLHEVRPEL